MKVFFGIHAVASYLKKPAKGVVLWAAKQSDNERVLACIAQAESLGITVKYSNKAQLQKMAKGGNHQGLVLVTPLEALAQRTEKDFFAFFEKRIAEVGHRMMLLVLDGVTDPHNLGACMRTANGAGVDAVIIPKAKAVGLTPVAVKVASGAAGETPLFEVSNLARVLRALADAGVWLVGLDDKAEESVYEVNYPGSVAFVLGSEGSGIRRLTKEICQQLVTIPMLGSVSSLNVSVASGIVLYEGVRQHRNR